MSRVLCEQGDGVLGQAQLKQVVLTQGGLQGGGGWGVRGSMGVGEGA